MIYSIDQVEHLHLEISSLCNAACPLCPRTFNGYAFNQGYTEHNMTLAEAQQIFPPEFVRQLKRMIINGNFGDAVMNPDTVDIVRYFKENNPGLRLNISTNGGARNTAFWQELANLGAEVTFCIDGLDNQTHALYRRNTLYTTVMKNSATFIAAGGRALWKMIKFEHNQHQHDLARTLSQQLGFTGFFLIDDGRDTCPVYDSEGNLDYIIGPSKLGFEPPARVEPMLRGHVGPEHQTNQIYWVNQVPIQEIYCEVKYSKSIYVSSTGDVFPCCYVGMNPREFRDNSNIGYGLAQINQLMSNNNALESSLAECIKWFDQLEQTWTKPDFESGRPVICNISCGGESKRPQFHVQRAEYVHHRQSTLNQNPDKGNG